MAIPKQVEEAGKLADELLEKQANPELESKEAAEKAEEEAKQKAEAEAKAAEEKPAEEKEPDEETWQQKYNTLQGKFNAEVKDTRQTNQFLIDENLKLKAETEDLKSREPEPPKKLDLSEYLTPEQMAFLDDEMDPEVKNVIADLVQGVAASNVPKNTDLEQKVDSLEKGQAATSWEVFLGRVEKAFPNYETTVNLDPKFVEYMEEVVPGTGVTRQVIMDNAAQNLNHTAVIEMYADFTKQAPANPDPLLPKKDLKSLIDPVDKLAVQGDQLIPSSDKMYTVNDVKTHYKEMALGESSNYTKGKYANNPDLAKSVDAAILAANAEGRITR